MERLPMFYKGLTPELIRKAEEELNETPEVKAKALKELKELIKGHDDIFCNMEDKYLLSFLRVKKFNVEKSLKVLHNYTSIHQKYSGIFTNRLPSELKSMVDMNLFYFSPYRLPDMSHVSGTRLRLFDPSKAKFEDIIAYMITWGYILVEHEVVQIAGLHLILDLSDVTFHQYLSMFTISVFKFAAWALQDSFPLRIRGIHIINGPLISKSLYNVAKVFGKKKLVKKMHFYDDMESFHKNIPKEYLPQWYGGTMTPMDGEELATIFYSYEDIIEGRRHYKTLNAMS